MSKLFDYIDLLETQASKNLSDAKILVQPERSWIRDQETILKLSSIILSLHEALEGTTGTSIEGSELDKTLNKIIDYKYE